MWSVLWPVLASFWDIRNIAIAEPKLRVGHTLPEDILLVMHIACPSAGLIIIAVEVPDFMLVINSEYPLYSNQMLPVVSSWRIIPFYLAEPPVVWNSHWFWAAKNSSIFLADLVHHAQKICICIEEFLNMLGNLYQPTRVLLLLLTHSPSWNMSSVDHKWFLSPLKKNSRFAPLTEIILMLRTESFALAGVHSW
jgi:hypothetical protein